MRYYRLASLCFGLAPLLPGQIQQSTRSTPGQVCGLTEVDAVAAGGIGGLALKADGTVWEWYGPSPPAQVSGLSDIVAIAADIGHNMALTSGGTVWEWTGPWWWGGPGRARPTRTPSQVSNITDVVAIAAGESRSLAVKSDGTVWEWTGEPAAGFSGVAAQAPYQVTGLGGGVSAVSVAFKRPFADLWLGELLLVRSLALRSDRTVLFWDEWEMGITQPPTWVSGLTDVLAISASDPDNLALKSDGTVWEWSHAYGWWWEPEELPPFQVTGLTGVVAVAAGGAHQLALKSDGSVWSWGHNEDGQLGDGTTTYRASPVQVRGIGEVAKIAAASVYRTSAGLRPVSLALLRDGTVWSWGETWNAWLGDGRTCEEPQPTRDSRLR